MTGPTPLLPEPDRREPAGYIPYPGYAEPPVSALPSPSPIPGYYTPSAAQQVVVRLDRGQRRMARQAARIDHLLRIKSERDAAAAAALARLTPDPEAPYGRDPVSGEPLSPHSRAVAAILQLFLGPIGAGRFYIGDQRTGFITMGILICAILAVSLFPLAYFWIIFPALGLWSIADFIMILSGNIHDTEGRKLR